MVLDIDGDGRILGIEIVGATAVLDRSLLDRADRDSLVLRALVRVEHSLPRPPFRPPKPPSEDW